MYKLSKNKEEEIKEAEFHKKRIAFLIVNNEILFLQNSPMTHYEWAKSINIDVSNFDEITRGYALNNEIFFYHGNLADRNPLFRTKRPYPDIFEFYRTDISRVLCHIIFKKYSRISHKAAARYACFVTTHFCPFSCF